MVARDADFAAAVLDSLHSGVVAVDAEGAIALINETGRRILGCPTGDAQAALGVPCERALAQAPSVARLLLETLAGRRPLSRAELRLERAGARATLGFSLSALRVADGRVQGAAMLFRDLTPIERSDERERLKERLAALGQMAAGLAHEMRNPLAGMEVVAGLLQRRLGGDPDSRELIEDLRGQLAALSQTVTASLDFLRPAVLQREPLDPCSLVEEALARALQRAPRTVEVERRFASPLPKLFADRNLLGSALANLIVNACEAMGSTRGPARLELALEVVAAPEYAVALPGGEPLPLERGPSRELCISVTDTGPGIPPDVRDKIFDLFFTTKQTGSGIGLANVQKIVTGHGGALSVESTSAGSVFRVHLPLLEEVE